MYLPVQIKLFLLIAYPIAPNYSPAQLLRLPFHFSSLNTQWKIVTTEYLMNSTGTKRISCLSKSLEKMPNANFSLTESVPIRSLQVDRLWVDKIATDGVTVGVTVTICSENHKSYLLLPFYVERLTVFTQLAMVHQSYIPQEPRNQTRKTPIGSIFFLLCIYSSTLFFLVTEWLNDEKLYCAVFLSVEYFHKSWITTVWQNLRCM